MKMRMAILAACAATLLFAADANAQAGVPITGTEVGLEHCPPDCGRKASHGPKTTNNKGSRIKHGGDGGRPNENLSMNFRKGSANKTDGKQKAIIGGTVIARDGAKSSPSKKKNQ